MTASGLALLILGLGAAVAGELAAVRRDVVQPHRLRPSEMLVITAVALLAPRIVEILT